MSIAMLNLCWPVQVSPAEKAVLMVFADASSDNGHCWLLLSSIAVKTCLGNRTISRAVTSLEARGYVRRELRRGRSSIFYLIPDVIKSSVLPKDETECRPLTHAAAAIPTHANAACSHANAASTHAAAACTHANAACITTKEPEMNQNTHQAQSARACVGFDEFKDAYPRKASMAEARRVWDRLAPGDDLRREIMAAIARQKLGDQWQRGIVPHPATWLRNRRWEDITSISAPGNFTPVASNRICACGAVATVMVDQRWHCREHNPNRKG